MALLELWRDSVWFFDVSGEKRCLYMKFRELKKLELEHVVLDYNGTVAVDGVLVPGVREILNRLSRACCDSCHNSGYLRKRFKESRECEMQDSYNTGKGDQDRAKLDYVVSFGSRKNCCQG